jgi:hypothetical protein
MACNVAETSEQIGKGRDGKDRKMERTRRDEIGGCHGYGMTGLLFL